MARPPKDVICMFCRMAPCECNKKPEKPKATPRPRRAKPAAVAEPDAAATPAPTPTPAPSRRAAPSMLGAMQRAAAATAKPSAATPDEPEGDQEDHIDPAFGYNEDGLAGALQALWPIMHKADREKHATTVGPEFVHAARKKEWKERNGR